MKVSLLYSELRALLAPVIPFAGTDDMLPILQRIAIATSGPYLVAQATDRFTAGFQRVQPSAPVDGEFTLLLMACDAKRMLHLLRPLRGSDPKVTITIDEHGVVHVSADDAGLALGFRGIDVSFSSPVIGDGFPDLVSVLPKDLTDTVGEVGLNLDLLTKFRTALELNRESGGPKRLPFAIHMPTSVGKPITITAGDDFVGIVMPLRPENHSGIPAQLDTWRPMIPRNGIKAPATEPETAAGLVPPKELVSDESPEAAEATS
jgi:hypothetical protein